MLNRKTLLFTEDERRFQEMRAISETLSRELASRFFFSLQVKEPKEINTILTVR